MAMDPKSYWRGMSVNVGHARKTWAVRKMIEAVTQIVEADPAMRTGSVFEFGCGTGRILHHLGEAYPSMKLKGLDLNPSKARYGRERFGLDVSVGDEKTLKTVADASYDLVYTCSVLDHIRKPLPVLTDLGRVSRRYVLLFEPWTGIEGRVDPRSTKPKRSPPQTYSWNYDKLIPQAGMRVMKREKAEGPHGGMGPYYYLWISQRDGVS